MARCDNCLANKVCDHHRFGFENCGSYISAADVAPKSEVEKWQGRCREWHEVAELKSNRIMELDEGLAKANAEIKRLHGILLQFTDIVHKWGARNGIDTSEISLVPILQKEADGIVGKMEQEIETLKDNNEHIAALLEEAKDEANRYKRYYFHHDYDKMIAEAKAEVAREFIEIINDRIDNIRARIPYGGRAQGKTLAVEKMRLLESLKVEIAKKYTEDEG